MKTYNVLYAVVDIIEAEDEEEAVDKLRAKLRTAGFEPYEGFNELLPENYKLAFASEFLN